MPARFRRLQRLERVAEAELPTPEMSRAGRPRRPGQSHPGGAYG